MTLQLYTISDDSKKASKTLGTATTIQGTLVQPVSLRTPSFRVSYSSNTFPTFNYAYITESDRYYYITNITAISYNEFIISMRSDPLMSFLNDIKNNYAMVIRTGGITGEVLDNQQYRDPLSYVGEESNITKITPSTLTSGWTIPSNANSGNHWILQYRTGNYNGSVGSYGTPPPFGMLYVAMSKSAMQGVLSDVINQQNTAEAFSKYAVTMRYSPIAIPSTTAVNTFDLNVFLVGIPQYIQANVSPAGSLMSNDGGTYSAAWKFSLPSAITSLPKWKKSQEYVSYSVKFLPFGTFSIPNNILYDATDIYIKATVDPITGGGALLYSSDNTNWHTAVTAPICYDFQYSTEGTTIFRGLSQVMKSSANIALSAAPLVANMREEALNRGSLDLLDTDENFLLSVTGQDKEKMGFATNFLPSIANSIINRSGSPDLPTCGGTSGSRIFDAEPTLYISSKTVNDAPNSLYGTIVNRYIKLSNCSGLTVVNAINLDGVGCTEDEKAEIRSRLTNGVIL